MPTPLPEMTVVAAQKRGVSVASTLKSVSVAVIGSFGYAMVCFSFWVNVELQRKKF